jgi:hypothetical protein
MYINRKMQPGETIPGIGGGGMKKNGGENEFSMI